MIEIPDPANSPNEKWQPTRWGVGPRTERLRQLLLREGVEEGLALGFAMAMGEWATQRAFTKREVLEEFSRWANTHTHEFVSSPEPTIEPALFIVQGDTGTGFESFDPVLDVYQTLPDSPVVLGGSGATVYDNKIFYFSRTANGALGSDCYVYDIINQAWGSLAALPTARYGTACITSPLGIHCLGGTDVSGGLVDHLLYDPSTDSYSSLAPLPQQNRYAAVTYFDGHVYSIGGEYGNEFKLHRYDISLDSWVTLLDSPQSVRYGYFVEYNSVLHFHGLNSTTHRGWDTVSESYVTFASSPEVMNLNSISGKSGDYLYCKPSTTASGLANKRVFEYSFLSDTWSVKSEGAFQSGSNAQTNVAV